MSASVEIPESENNNIEAEETYYDHDTFVSLFSRSDGTANEKEEEERTLENLDGIILHLLIYHF